jgi:hypothetical protein
VTRSLLAVFCLCALAHARGASSPDQVYSFDPTVVHSPVTILAPESEIPDEARRQQLEGLCALTIVVDRKGLPQNPRIVRCTDPIFTENSMKVVKKYRFVPATTVADNKPVLFRMHIEISYKFGPDPTPVPLPRPRIKIGFLIPSQSAPPKHDSNGVYTLSREFDPPNSFPQIQLLANAGFGRAAFSLEDGAGCIAALTIDETGHTTDAQITKCDDSSLENPVLRSLWKSQFSPAVMNGKPVPIHTSVHLVCEGFGAPSGP